MSTTQKRKAFDDAHARFKVAEKELQGLQGKAATSTALLLDAKLALAGYEKQFEEFATGADAGNPAAASTLIAGKANAEGVVDLLERSADYLAREVARGTIDVLTCETACNAAQSAFLSADVDDKVADFLQSNRTAVQKLAQPFLAGGGNVPSLLRDYLPDAMSTTWGNDESFLDGCTPAARQPVNERVQSTMVDGHARSKASAALHFGRDAAITALAIPEPLAVDTFNHGQAIASMRSLEAQADECDSQASQARERAVRAANTASPHAGKSADSAIDDAVRFEAAAQRLRDQRDAWRQKISEHQAAA
ncbi:MAG: hypothetical protein ABIS07_17365 [Dokdonella sp.]